MDQRAIKLYEFEVHKGLRQKQARLDSLTTYSDQVGTTLSLVEDLPKRLSHQVLGKIRS